MAFLPEIKADTQTSTVVSASEISSNSMSKNMLYVNGTGYMFYFYAYSGYGIKYKRANDTDSPAVWTEMGWVTTTSSSPWFSLDFDDKNRIVYFVYVGSGTYFYKIYFKKGIYADGNFTWGTEKTVFTCESESYWIERPDIGIDTLNNKLLVAFNRRYTEDPTKSSIKVRRSTNLDGDSWADLTLRNGINYAGYKWVEWERDPISKNLMIIYNYGANFFDIPYPTDHIACKIYNVGSQIFNPSSADTDIKISQWYYYGLGDFPISYCTHQWKTNFYNGAFHIVFQNYSNTGYSWLVYKKFNATSLTWVNRTDIASGLPCMNTGIAIFGNSTREIIIYNNATENNIYYKWRVHDGYGAFTTVFWRAESLLNERYFKSAYQHSNTIDVVFLSWAKTDNYLRQANLGLTPVVNYNVEIDVLIDGLNQGNYTDIAVVINGTSYYFGQIGSYPAGTYSLSFVIPSNLSLLINFNSWSYNGSITVANNFTETTTLTVNGNGYIILNLNYSGTAIIDWWLGNSLLWLGLVGLFLMVISPIMTIKLLKEDEIRMAGMWILVALPIGVSFVIGWLWA